ncbi:ABC transporter substrate-binding protein [Nesterenkonia haasae]|uniref:ABC transporter substrate-binding protein n=1 Tax=Nesterenkonia haasae TaxID=2587813 RepID=UPI0013913AE5|nr:ABC transporter substrate-binding protein [Nesterenkonia haasae]NDK31689.1 ABC transporter substrate-binding protein [Nesterenkonia haasae]
MRTTARGVTTLASLAITTLALTACGGATPQDAEGEDGGNGSDTTLRAAVAYETDNYHPSSTASALAMGANWHVMEGLFELDMTTGEPYAALSAEDELTEISETEYEVTLRDEARFSDGEPVTAADVVASFEKSADPDNIYGPMLSFIDEVTEVDETTVSITLRHPFSLVKERLALVKIVPADASDEELTSQPIGTGPWTYESISQASVDFVPNEHYNGDRPAQAGAMEWDVILDDTARTTSLQEGTVHVAEAVPADMQDVITGSGAEVEAVQGFNLPFLMFNTTKEPFDDPAVRQAVHYAIDVEQLIENAMSGTAQAATSFLPEDHPNYNEAANVYDHDPERAQELLDEAGVEDLSLTLVTTDHAWISALGPQIQNDLGAVGIDVSLQEEASASLYANYTDVEVPTYDVALAPGDPSVFGNDPDLLMNWWYGDNIWTQQRSFWGETEAFEEFHGLLDEAVQAEGDEQQQLWNEAFDLISEEVPIYPLFHREVLTGYQPDAISGFEPIGTTGLNLLGAEATDAE